MISPGPCSKSRISVLSGENILHPFLPTMFADQEYELSAGVKKRKHGSGPVETKFSRLNGFGKYKGSRRDADRHPYAALS